MKIFRELYVYNVNDKGDFIRRIKGYVSQDWSYKMENIEMLEYLYFDYLGTKMPNARVAMLFHENGTTLNVVNIIPLKKNELDVVEYNQILMAFYNDIMKPFSDDNHQIVVKPPTSDEFDPIQVISPDALDKLKKFHDCSNRATGATDPRDKRLWLDFLHQTVADGKMFDTDVLYRFLQDEDYWGDEAWDEEVASKLSEEYEQGCEVLEYAKQ